MTAHKRRRLLAVALGLAVIVILSLSGWLSPQPAPRYLVTDLGVLPGASVSGAYSLNSRGDVVGLSGDPSGLPYANHAFLYREGKMTDLSAKRPPGNDRAIAINDKGEIIVNSWPDRGTESHAFLYSGGKMRNIGTLPGFMDSKGVGIDDRGEIAGNTENSAMQPGLPYIRAFLYSRGRMTALRLPPGCSESHAMSINAAGQIVGKCRLALGGTRPFVYDSRTGTMTMLAVPTPCIRGWAYRANSAGQIIGDVSLPDGSCHAVLWRGNQMSDLGTPSGYQTSIGTGLNNRGEAVGESFSEANPVKAFLQTHLRGGNALRRYLDRDTEHAFVYRDGKMQDLNELITRDADWTLEKAQEINDQGQIVGSGLHHGQERGFLLTPQ